MLVNNFSPLGLVNDVFGGSGRFIDIYLGVVNQLSFLLEHDRRSWIAGEAGLDLQSGFGFDFKIGSGLQDTIRCLDVLLRSDSPDHVSKIALTNLVHRRNSAIAIT